MIADFKVQSSSAGENGYAQLTTPTTKWERCEPNSARPDSPKSSCQQ